MRAKTKGKHEMGKRFAILMKRRIRIAGATLAVAAGLIGAVAAMAGQATPIGQARRLLLSGSLTPTIVGTSGNDALHGTPGPDVIAGRGGRDSASKPNAATTCSAAGPGRTR